MNKEYPSNYARVLVKKAFTEENELSLWEKHKIIENLPLLMVNIDLFKDTIGPAAINIIEKKLDLDLVHRVCYSLKEASNTPSLIQTLINGALDDTFPVSASEDMGEVTLQIKIIKNPIEEE